MKATLIAIAGVVLAFIVLLLLALGFVELFLWATGVLNLHKQLGTSAQTTENYAFVSGIGPMVVTTLGFAGILVTAFRHFNCHVNSPSFCWRFGHPVEGTSFRACKAHHPSQFRQPHGKVSADHIEEAHTEARK